MLRYLFVVPTSARKFNQRVFNFIKRIGLPFLLGYRCGTAEDFHLFPFYKIQSEITYLQFIIIENKNQKLDKK